MSAGGQSEGCNYSSSVSGPVASLSELGLCSALALITASPRGKPVCCFESNSWKYLVEGGGGEDSRLQLQ